MGGLAPGMRLAQGVLGAGEIAAEPPDVSDGVVALGRFGTAL